MSENEPEESAREIPSPFSKLEGDNPNFMNFGPQEHGLTVEDVVEEIPLGESSSAQVPADISTSSTPPAIPSKVPVLPQIPPPLPGKLTPAFAAKGNTPPKG